MAQNLRLLRLAGKRLAIGGISTSALLILMWGHRASQLEIKYVISIGTAITFLGLGMQCAVRCICDKKDGLRFTGKVLVILCLPIGVFLKIMLFPDVTGGMGLIPTFLTLIIGLCMIYASQTESVKKLDNSAFFQVFDDVRRNHERHPINSKLIIGLAVINIGVFIFAKSTYTQTIQQARNIHEQVFGGGPIVDYVEWNRIGPIMAASAVISIGLFVAFSKREKGSGDGS